MEWKEAGNLKLSDKLRNPDNKFKKLLLLETYCYGTLKVHTYNKDLTSRQIFVVSACHRFVDINKKIVLAKDSLNTLLFNGWRILNVEEGKPSKLVSIQVEGGFYLLGGSNAVMVGDDYDTYTRKYEKSLHKRARVLKGEIHTKTK